MILWSFFVLINFFQLVFFQLVLGSLPCCGLIPYAFKAIEEIRDRELNEEQRFKVQEMKRMY